MTQLVLGDVPVPLLVQFDKDGDFNATIEITDTVTGEPSDLTGKTFRLKIDGLTDLDAVVDGNVVTWHVPVATVQEYAFNRVPARLLVLEGIDQTLWADGEAVVT